MGLSDLPCIIKKLVLPTSARWPVNGNVHDEERLPMVMVSRAHLFFEVENDVHVTKLLREVSLMAEIFRLPLKMI